MLSCQVQRNVPEPTQKYMKNTRNAKIIAVIATGLLTSYLSALANEIVDFTTPTVNYNNNVNWTLAFEFQVNQAITIDTLSIYDDFTNGQALSHLDGLC